LAKVSKINIAITGDAKGFAAASDAAVREMRRLQAASETTSRKMQSVRSSVTKTADALSKFGVANRALGALGGGLQLAQTAIGGGGIGAGAIGLGLGLGGVTAAFSAAQQITEVTARARKAIDEVTLDARKRIQESGFSEALARSIANQGFGVKSAGQTLGAFDSLMAGLAATPTGAMGGQMLSNLLPAGAAAAGVMLGGGGISQAQQIGAAQMMSGDEIQDKLMAYHASMSMTSPAGPIGYVLQQLWSK
jgi:hypothetical protein